MRGTYQGEPFFAFHHVNAYERGGEIILDVCAYNDADIIDALYLDRVRTADVNLPDPQLRRYRLPLADGASCYSQVGDERAAQELRDAFGVLRGRPPGCSRQLPPGTGQSDSEEQIGCGVDGPPAGQVTVGGYAGDDRAVRGSPEIKAVTQRGCHCGVLILVRLKGASEGIDARRVGGMHLDHPPECFHAGSCLGYPR